MAEIIYTLCAITSFLCAILLLRAYQKTKTSLLLWSSVCFFCLVVANLVLVLDLIVFPDLELGPYRNGITVLGYGFLIYGLVWDGM